MKDHVVRYALGELTLGELWTLVMGCWQPPPGSLGRHPEIKVSVDSGQYGRHNVEWAISRNHLNLDNTVIWGLNHTGFMVEPGPLPHIVIHGGVWGAKIRFEGSPEAIRILNSIANLS